MCIFQDSQAYDHILTTWASGVTEFYHRSSGFLDHHHGSIISIEKYKGEVASNGIAVRCSNRSFLSTVFRGILLGNTYSKKVRDQSTLQTSNFHAT